MTRLATRDKILQAAREVFAEKGYHRALVDDIVRASQTSKGAVYHHFPNKEALFLALGDEFAGRVAEGPPLPQRAIERAAAMRVLVNQSQRIAWLGELTLLDGCHDEAIRLGQDALELARAHKERGHEAWALRLLGQAHATRGVSGARHAEGYYRQALEIADERGMRPLQAKCHLGLGRALKVLDGQVQPDSHLMRADEIFRQIGMRDAIQTIAPT